MILIVSVMDGGRRPEERKNGRPLDEIQYGFLLFVILTRNN